MKRSHYLRPLGKGNVQPVVLSAGIATGTRTTRLAGVKRKYIVCKAWCLHAWDTANGPDKPKMVLQGDCPVDLWSAVAAILQAGRTTWLWSLGLRELLTLTDWYGLLQQGAWTIGGKDQGSEIEEIAGIKRHFRGYLIDNDPPSIVLCQHRTTGATLQIVDTKNFGVEAWSQMTTGCKDMDMDLQDKRGCYPSSIDMAFARSRAVGQWAVSWSRLVCEQHWGPLRPSAAGQAMTTYRSKCISAPILIHDNMEARNLERDAYFPGRCEAYRIGQVKGPVYHCDVQSCYPTCSAGNALPSRLKGFDGAGITDIRALLGKGWNCICDVTVRTANANLPCRRGREVFFPQGRFRTCLAGPELTIAMQEGEVLQTHRIAWYEISSLFRKWTEEMLSVRSVVAKEGNLPLLTAVKCLTNSIYGAFAKRSRRWIPCTCRPAPAPFAMWFGQLPCQHQCPKWKPQVITSDDIVAGKQRPITTRWRSLGWKVEYETAPQDADDTLPAVSAWVASLARVHLLKLLRCCGVGEVYYTDTDSLWCSQRGFENLKAAGYIKDGTPGYLKLVKVYPSIYIYGSKSYSAGDSGANCGTPTGSVVDDEGNAEWYSMEGVYSAARRKSGPGCMLIHHRRSRRTNYTGGIVHADGTVTPLTLDTDV